MFHPLLPLLLDEILALMCVTCKKIWVFRWRPKKAISKMWKILAKICKDCTRRNKQRNPGQHREKQQRFVRKKPTKLLAPPMRQHLLFWVFCKFLRLLRGLQRGLQLLSCFCKQTCIQNTKRGNNRGPHRPINSSFQTLAKVFESAGFWK